MLRTKPKTAGTKIHEAVQSYQEAKSDEEKQKAQEAISTALSDYFEADMKGREEDIQEIEERVKKLRAQLEKRRNAKEEILKLQLQVMINEAEGLGFYAQPRGNSGRNLERRRSRATLQELTPPTTYWESNSAGARDAR